MPILDRRANQLIEDQDTRVSVGIDFPFARVPNQDGYFKTTKTTVESIKNNIKLLLQAEQGERVFQPASESPGDFVVPLNGWPGGAWLSGGSAKRSRECRPADHDLTAKPRYKPGPVRNRHRLLGTLGRSGRWFNLGTIARFGYRWFGRSGY